MTLARRILPHHVVQGEPRPAAPMPAGSEPAPAVDEAAVERGFAQGLAAGQEAADAACAARLAELDTLQQAARDEDRAALDAMRCRYDAAIARLSREVEDDRMWAEGMAVEVAFAAVSRWLGNHRFDAGIVETLCIDAMRDHARVDYVVRTSPADAGRLAAASLAVGIVADATLADGDLRLDSARGTFDAGIGSRLDALRDALLAGLAEGAARV